MMNIKSEKEMLRQKYKELRLSFTKEEKAEYDRAILRRVTSLDQYKGSQLILTYVSKDIEVDTLMLIQTALSQGRKVAVPKCIGGTRDMRFYYITGIQDLEKSTFGVLEPVVSQCAPADKVDGAFCVVPGMAFDSRGYRLGYGKGYYDRFLSGFCGVTAGLCYSGCIKWNLPRGRFDKPVDLIVTERFFRKTDSANRYRKG